MMYSISRFNAQKPVPPFELGGTFSLAGAQPLLVDAINTLELHTKQKDVFDGLKPGDLVVVRVTKSDEFGVMCDQARRVFASQSGESHPPKPHITRFTAFTHRVRDYFLENGLSEILTPTLVRCPGLEPTLEPFSTEVVFGRHRLTAYLPTSPEIHLKKAMTRGWTDIFEIKSCFRKGEFSSHHDNEFLMLEWYRSFADLGLIEGDLRGLLRVLGKEGWIKGGEIELAVTDFAELFDTYLDFALKPNTTRDELAHLCEVNHVHHTPEDSFNDLFHRLFVDRIEPELKSRGPVLVYRFPPSMAALARLDGEGWADRFEFYWRGFEIANAFHEVTDPDEQAKRWVSDQEERQRLGTSAVPHDPGLIKAMRRGLPPSGGIALGLERLYMACFEIDEIKDLRLFSTRDLF